MTVTYYDNNNNNNNNNNNTLIYIAPACLPYFSFLALSECRMPMGRQIT